MLDEFLEKRVQKKLQLFNSLMVYSPITLNSLMNLLKTTDANVKSLIHDLNLDFDGLAVIERNQTSFSIVIRDNVNPIKLLHALYKESVVLQCLKFLITNEVQKPYWIFIEEMFYSTASAYRIKKKCLEYLNIIGLDIDNNKVIGEEYRIRYLIALLYYKYGVDCCGIDADSIKIARNFILSTNQAIDLSFLETTVNEYGYFECLLILAWKRKKYSPFSTKLNELQQLNSLFIHYDMQEHLRTCIEEPLQIEFSELDRDYIFLIYCSTNSCVLADKWTKDEISKVREIVLLNNSSFSNLFKRIENKFGKEVASSPAMRAVLIYFYKKFILEMQCIIPEKHFYLHYKKTALTLTVIRQMTELLDSWRKENQIQYPIDNSSIQYLAFQMEAILRQFTKPVSIILVTDQIVELRIMELMLARKFSEQRIKIELFLLNAQQMDFFDNLKDSVIILNKKFKNVPKFLELSKRNKIIPVSIEFNSIDMEAIKSAIVYYEEKFFKELIYEHK